jgi:hypothetical protein
MTSAVDDQAGTGRGTPQRRGNAAPIGDVAGGTVETAPSASPPPAATHTVSIKELLTQHRDGQSVTAGAVVAELLDNHIDYLDKEIEKVERDAIAAAGPARTVAKHVEVAERRWDPTRAPVLSGRHVVLALAIDADLGWSLLQSGVIAAILDTWQPGLGTAEEPKRVVWDVLADAGRDAAEEQPLLAAAFGAPAEWSVELPHPATAIAWAPEGDRLALVAGDTVYEAAAGEEVPRRVAKVGTDVVSLAWGSQGLITLQVSGDTAQITRVPKASPLFSWPGATNGLLSGDGTLAWLATSDGVSGWTPGRTQPVHVAPPGARPLALDSGGRRGLVGRSSDSVLIAGLPGSPPSAAAVPDQPAPAPPDWPPDAAQAVGVGPPGAQPCALVVSAATTLIAVGRHQGGVDLQQLPGPVVARIATGPEQVTALASHPVQAGVAVACGHQIGVWTLSRKRRSARLIPGYDSDRVGDADLLEADRDARALAALIASAQLHPPISIGLFGAWGSGKSFVLRRIQRMLGEFTKQGAAQGYLERIEFVSFNAWHYAETNLWASMVDQVLRKIGGAAPPDSQPQEVARAKTAATIAEQQAKKATKEVTAANEELEKAKRRFKNRRQRFWLLGSLILLLVAGAIAAAALGASAGLVAAVSAALALLGSLTAALDQVRKASDQANQLAAAGRDGLGGLTRLAGRTEELAVQAAATTLRDRTQKAQAAHAQARQLRLDAVRATQRLEAEPVRAILDELASVTEYRDLLSLVTRTRERFASIDTAVTAASNARRGPDSPTEAPDGGSIQRVVIAIDDLDRCPPDKVITVLEAVHLLFDFPMFVVLLAVDTRWLEQSLRIRYRQLLGETDTATPADYLEKIIQVPLYLLPLDKELVRTMLTGLIGQAMDGDPTPPRPGPDPHRPYPPDPDTTGPARKAEKGRSARPPLPAEVLHITPAEADAMSAVATLLGTTPRTVKRFVNTYRLLKARTLDPERFDEPVDGLGDHQIVAFLLALVTGHPQVAGELLPALVQAPEAATITSLAAALPIPENPSSEVGSAAEAVRSWLAEHPDYAQTPARRCAALAQEVARFSFTAPTMTAPITPT